MAMIYRVLGGADWEAFRASGWFAGTADDVRDGFIHFSAEHQLAGTVAKHYANRTDLVLLHVDTEQLARSTTAELKWEASRGGDLFPHLYGALPLEAVGRAEPFPETEQAQP